MTDYQKLARMIYDIDFTMMTTEGSDGSLYSRPMSTQKIDEDDFSGQLWFFTQKNSPKVQELEEHQKVNLAYADPSKQTYVSVAGRTTLVFDKEKMKELWKPVYKAWFPEGLDDPHICLIRVDVETAEFWDSPSSKLVQAFEFVKSALTGEPYKNAGQNQQLNFRSSPGIH